MGLCGYNMYIHVSVFVRAWLSYLGAPRVYTIALCIPIVDDDIMLPRLLGTHTVRMLCD
jgi:hypothetical protein